MSRNSHNPDLRVSSTCFGAEAQSLAKPVYSAKADTERRNHASPHELTDHRGRPLGQPGCWDVDEVHEFGLCDCLVALAEACRKRYWSDMRKASFLNIQPGEELQLQVLLTAHALLCQGYKVRYIHKSKYVPPDVWQGDIWEHWVFCFEMEGELPRTISLKYEVGDEDGVCFWAHTAQKAVANSVA